MLPQIPACVCKHAITGAMGCGIPWRFGCHSCQDKQKPTRALEKQRGGPLIGQMQFLGKIIKGVIFDMDGLLLDTERISMRAWQVGARQYGIEMPEELFLKMIGHRNEDCLAILQEFAGRDIPREAIARTMYADYEHQLEEGVPLMPGAGELVAKLAAEGVPLAVATSTHRALACKKLAAAGLLRFFHGVTGGDQVAHGKPAPDIYLAALDSLHDALRKDKSGNILPWECLAFEDSSPGVLAATAANMHVVAIPDLTQPTPEARQRALAVAPSLLVATEWFAA